LGDWKKITPHEKKVLYRASYCQTFAEMNAPTGEWKMITGMILFALGISMWMVIWCQKYGKTNNYLTIFSQSLI
jgi:cytochrome c oxidase subunit 4